MSKSPKYDPQREEVYWMEKHGLFGLNRSRITRAEHKELLHLVCSKYGVEPPRLRYAVNKRWAGYYECVTVPTITVSTVYVGGLSAMTLLHELAHYMIHRADPDERFTPHGPEFVGLYGDIMERAGFVPFGAWDLLVDQFGLDTIQIKDDMTPKRLLAYLKKRAAEAAPKSPHQKEPTSYSA
jgi:hypothetical protein